MKKISVFSLTLICMLTKPSIAQTEVTFYTTMGTFTAQMYDTLQPITAGNFISLVNEEFYDEIIFHRVINGFMIQGGDPLGTGYGNAGYTIVDEFDPLTSNVQQAIAMANAGPNTGSSQFFINLVHNTYLDPNYPVFGIVTSNFSVVTAIGVVPTTGSSGSPANKPLTDVVMDSVRVTSAFTATDEFSTQSFNFNIFPNPATDETTISIIGKADKFVNISIYNQQGENVYSKQTKLLKGINNIPLKKTGAATFSQGIYYIVVADENSVSQKKFIFLK